MSPQSPHQTSRRDRQRGQILVVFAGGLIAFLAIAALVFDVGQNLMDWRAQRDAADASALAGSRYIADATCYANPSIANCPSAYQAALKIAATNGYGDTNGDGTDDRGHVTVLIPPQHGEPLYRQKGFLEVDIHTDRPSFFAAVLGMLHQNVDAFAVAGNSSDVAPPYSLLALKTDCGPGIDVGGGGTVTVLNGSVVSNSCGADSIWTHGGGSLTAPECDAVGGIDSTGQPADMNCTKQLAGFGGTSDPLAGLPPPPMPQWPPKGVDTLLWNGGKPVSQEIPTGCPSSTTISVVTDANGNPSTAFAASDHVNLPYFQPGDLALVQAYNNNDPVGNKVPTRPDNSWTVVGSAKGAGVSGTVGRKFLTNSDTTTGTWNNATAIQVIIVHGVNASPIGKAAFLTSAGGTLTTPSLEPLGVPAPAQTSWVVAFAGSDATSAAPANTTDIPADSGQPTPTRRSGPIAGLALHTGEGVGHWTSRGYTPVTNATKNWTAAIELEAALPSTATASNPTTCAFKGGASGQYNVYRIYPGVYYGGISLSGPVRVYMAPGTYWIAGGGLDVASAVGAQLISDSGGTGFSWPNNLPAPGRGVLIYNTDDIANGTNYCTTLGGSACAGPIGANGGSDPDCTVATTKWRTPDYPTTDPTLKCAWVHLEPNDSPYKNLLIFVDRNVMPPAADMTMNGNTGILEFNGTIYDPNGTVTYNGSADSVNNLTAQIIAYDFKFTGGGVLTLTYNADDIFHLKGVGLVQ